MGANNRRLGILRCGKGGSGVESDMVQGMQRGPPGSLQHTKHVHVPLPGLLAYVQRALARNPKFTKSESTKLMAKLAVQLSEQSNSN